MEATTYDPEDLALLLVQQWLAEKGYAEALSALEQQSGVLYDDSKLLQGAQLMQLVWQHVERQLEATEDEGAAEKREEAEALLRGGQNDWAGSCDHVIDGVHPANILAVRLLPDQDAVVTGAGDGQLRKVTFSGDTQWSVSVGSGGVLSLDLHPQARTETTLIAAGSMDGSISILDTNSGSILAAHRPHTKYVTRVVWAGDGYLLASCAYDQSVVISRVDRSGESASVSTVKQIPYTTAVQDVCFLQDGKTLVVALKDSSHLRIMDLHQPDTETRVNMNEGDDTHVSFFARQLRPSPCGRYLLVHTDKSRVLVLRTRDWSQLVNLYDMPLEQFHNPCTAWHRDSHYVYVAAAGAQVWVYHLGSAKVVAKITGHKINVRDIHYDAQRNMLATCSFDKAVRIYKADDPVQ